MSRWSGIPHWSEMDEEQRHNALHFLDAVTEEHAITGDLDGVVAMLRAGVVDQALLDAVAIELEAVARQVRRAAKVKAAKRNSDRDWDIYVTLTKSKLFGRPEDREKQVNDLAEELAVRHGIGSVRQVFAIAAAMKKRFRTPTPAKKAPARDR